MRLYCVYGSAAGTPEAQQETTEMVRACLLDAEGCGQVPALIAGDFNLTADCLGCAAELAVSGWADLHDAPTCAAGTAKRARRIDLLLANRLWQLRTAQVRVDWATGLSTHAAQFVDIEMVKAPMVRLWKPRKVAVGRAPELRKEEAWMQVEARGLLEGLVKSATVDERFDGLEHVMEQYYNARNGANEQLVARGGDVRWGRREARQLDGVAEAAKVAKAGRRARRLRELDRQWPPCGPLSFQANCVREALWRTDHADSAWGRSLQGLVRRAELEELRRTAEAEYAALSAGHCRSRRIRWQQWCKQTIQAQPGRVWGWIRQGSRPARLPWATEGGSDEARAH